MKKMNIKSEKGAITLVVLVTVLFMISFLVSIYIVTGNKAQVEKEATEQIINRYNITNEKAEEMYYTYYAHSKDEVPIYTTEQLLKIGSGDEIEINGTIYTFRTSSNYILMNDIGIDVSTYSSTYTSKFENRTWNIETVTTLTNRVTNYAYSSEGQSYNATATGTYKLEVWGAQGGYRSSSYGVGGLGGYSIGTISLQQGTNIFVYVGGKGGYTTATGSSVVTDGYNGGGGASYYGGTGGGATDIRFTNGTWNNSTSLLSRVIVAGGGRTVHKEETAQVIKRMEVMEVVQQQVMEMDYQHI